MAIYNQFELKLFYPSVNLQWQYFYRIGCSGKPQKSIGRNVFERKKSGMFLYCGDNVSLCTPSKLVLSLNETMG